MQNFGGPQGQMYGGGGGGGGGGVPQGPPLQQQQQQQHPAGSMPFPQPTGISQQHNNQYKFQTQLQQFQQQRTSQLQHMHSTNQISQQQLHSELHSLNEKIQQAYSKYVSQVHQHVRSMQQQPGGGGAGGGGGGANQGPPPQPGQMPPPQMMTAADKKKLIEMQKQRQLAQQQQQMRFPPGSALQQQQQQQMRMQQYQQQQQQQGQGYPRGMQGPGYPGMQQMQQQQHGMGQMQQQQHMQGQQGQQPHGGPGSVAPQGSAQQQFQQQQQQYYQQQNQQMQHMHSQQLQAQQHQHQHQQQLQQQMAQAHQQEFQTPAPAPPPPAEKPEDVKYKELVKELNEKYLDILHAMARRGAQQKGIVQMINILEGQRNVPYDQLANLKLSLQKLMSRDCPTWPLLEQLRKKVFKTKEEQEKNEKLEKTPIVDKKELDEAFNRLKERIPTDDDDPMGVHPWSSVRHLTIRVPESIRMLYEKKTIKEEKTLKRPRDDDSLDDGYNLKKVKMEEDEGVENGAQIVEEDPEGIPPVFVIKTVFENRKPWIISPKAREELVHLSNWTIDEHCLPSCSATPFIIILVKSPSLLISPLRICLPRTYPSDPCTIQFDRTFPEDSEYGPLLQKLFEKNLGSKNSVRNLTDFIESYQQSCEEYIIYLPKYQTTAQSSPDQLSQSSTQSQKTTTPEMMYPLRQGVVVNQIGQKGIVM